ncbi:MAG: hypothetical protein F4X75_24440 [Gemmatimonadetes bacterium]|nr:hypothetical protein [Gemmatimonadota bacterium]
MASKTTYKASKTRSQNRPGWSVIFSHPRRTDTRGKFGLKVRRGLGTKDDAEADRLVEQLNQLLANSSWWSLDRRAEAEQQFDSVVVSAFFDNMEAGRVDSKKLREDMIRLPTPEDGYARVMLVGPTGAGKTTLLRQLIGSDHKSDRFPSTSTAKTTTADIEIVITPSHPFKAVVTFMTEHEVRGDIEECLEEACISAIDNASDKDIAAALLEHREQRFRLSYILGSWQQEQPEQEDDEYEMGEEETEAATLAEDEIVAGTELTENKDRLSEYIVRIKEVAAAVQKQTAEKLGDFKGIDNPNKRQDWLEDFRDVLYENQDFTRLSLDIMEAVQHRFNLIEEGIFDSGKTGWCSHWYYEEKDRNTFLKQVRWFTSNHSQQFGRLLTPLVNGIRVSGPFQPAKPELQDNDRKLVLLDGEGLGHSAKEATSISTKVTERFSETDMILLVDNAESPMQAAPLQLLETVGNSGHVYKISVVFTHFDQVKGDNLGNYTQKRDHVRAAIGNALNGLREKLTPSVMEMLEQRLKDNDFYLGGLNQATDRLPSGFIKDMNRLLEKMQESATSPDLPDANPIYKIGQLELALRDATDGFKNPWWGRLGLRYYEDISKEHWTRVKALCRRLAIMGADQYDGLRPVSDLIRQLEASISRWLETPDRWDITPPPPDDKKQATINTIRQKVSNRIHRLAKRRLINEHLGEWQDAFDFRGIGSSYQRAEEIERIYNAAAPSITSVTGIAAQKFLDDVRQVVKKAVEEVGGRVEGI